MTVLNGVDRYHLALEAIGRIPGLAEKAPDLVELLHTKLSSHRTYICENGEDMPEIRNWRWRDFRKTP